MAVIIVGLGNPGEEYKYTRHNTGMIVVDALAKEFDAGEFKMDKITSSMRSKTEDFIFLKPQTFMNKSGVAVKPLIKSEKGAEKLIVIHDDLDLPLGSIRISFNRGSGGHRGVESIVRAIKTEAFVRIRVGVSPQTASGKTKKPKGEEKVVNFILKKFKDDELKELKKVSKKIAEAITVIVEEGRPKAMSLYNS